MELARCIGIAISLALLGLGLTVVSRAAAEAITVDCDTGGRRRIGLRAPETW